MNEAAYNKASSAFKAEGIFDDLIDLVMKVVADLLANCSFTDAEIETKLDNPSLYVRWTVRNSLCRELFNTYGAGAWLKYDGEGLLKKVIAAGKKATASDIAAIKGNLTFLIRSH